MPVSWRRTEFGLGARWSVHRLAFRAGGPVLPPLPLSVPVAFAEQAIEVGEIPVVVDEVPEAFAVGLARPFAGRPGSFGSNPTHPRACPPQCGQRCTSHHSLCFRPRGTPQSGQVSCFIYRPRPWAGESRYRRSPPCAAQLLALSPSIVASNNAN